jgi:hypothetical protein
MTTAATIDAALRLGKSPHQVAFYFRVPLSQVFTRAEIMSRRKAETARKIAEKAKNAPRPDIEQLKRERNSLAKWVDMPITYEDEPTDPPFSHSRAYANTVALRRSREPMFSSGVSSVYGEGRFDWTAGSRM